MRYAIYYTPRQDEPLARIAANWLGRDPFGAATRPVEAVGDLSAAEVAFHTASARRYGFHATLKAPFRLAPNETEASLRAALDRFAEATPPVVIPSLVVGQIDGFFALVPEMPVPEVDQLANDVVVRFDRFRAPLNAAEIARRRPERLNAVQRHNLERWGYPSVFEEFRFHMTLTGPVEEKDRPRIARILDEFFAPVLAEPVEIANLALFVEPEPGAPFEVHSLHPLTGGRKS